MARWALSLVWPWYGPGLWYGKLGSGLWYGPGMVLGSGMAQWALTMALEVEPLVVSWAAP